jgi:hypothetical protein
MKSFDNIREKTLTPAELKKREEIAKAMERDNPRMDMGKKMAIATATAKRVAEAVDYEKLTQLARFGLVDKGNVQKLIAAFKKMEDGKILAPQQRELMLNVLTDLTGIITGDSQMFQKAKKAVKEGTLDEAVEHINILIEMTTAQKAKFDVLYKKMLGGSEHKAIRQKIMNPTKADDAFHAMVKRKAMSEEVESITELTAEEKRLINTMYDKKGNLTDIGKKVMDHGKKNRFPHNTSASQGKMMSGKSTMYSEDTQIHEAKLSQQQRDRLDDLIFNVMITGNIEYDGKDNPTRHLKTIEKEFGPKVAKQVEAGMDIKNWGRDNRSSGMDRLALRKKSRVSASGKMNKQDAVALGKRIMQDKSFGGLTKKIKLPEDTQIDEARPSQRHPLEGHPYHKKTNAELEYIGKDAHKAAQAMKGHNPSAEGKYLDQANDSATVRHFRKTSGTPDWYKKKYGHSMKEEAQIDEISMGKMAAYADKAVKSRNDAKARTYSADTHRVAKAGETIRKRKAGADNYNKKMWGYANVAPTKESVDEAKVGPSHDEIMKAIGNTQSSAQGMAILQKKFKLTAAQARKHMDMFLKDDVQIDEMGAFMSSPLPTPMSMRKDPPMTKPLMLTKRMNTAAALIKKAGNTPKLPTNEAVDSKKFDVYKKHMKTHNLDEPTVRMAHDNPDHGESKRMMKNPKYSKGLELYKASMKEATYSDTGWQKPEVKKDQSGNVIKTKNVAKTLAKSGLRRTKDLEAAQKAKYLTFSKVKK